MQQVLIELNSLDLYPKFVNHHISTEDQVQSVDLTRLNIMGVTVGRGDQFLKEMEQRMEQLTFKRRDLLMEQLEKLNSSDLYDILVDNDIGAGKLITLDDEELKKLGISYFRRRQFLGETKKLAEGKS